MKIFLTVLLIILSLFSLFVTIDESAMLIYNESFDRAVYSFAIAKGLNAIISVIQSSEVSASFIVGATIGVGQVLDPINDLIERFSWIMLASSVSIGIQHLLLLLGKSLFVKVAIVISAFIGILSMWVKKLHFSFSFVLSLKIIFLLLVLRFGAIVFIYTTQMFYNQVYAEQYESSTTYINEYKSELEEVQNNKQDLDGFWSKMENKMEVFSKKVIELITIFVVTTVIFPLLFLWFFISLIRWIFKIKFDDDKVLLLLLNKRK